MSPRTRALALTVTSSLVVLTPSVAPAAEPFCDKTDVFTARAGGYATYRIPGIVVTGKGTLLAYCEARKTSKSDWGAIDILIRRSTDGGRTWDEPRKLLDLTGRVPKNPVAVRQKIGRDGETTHNNPVAVVDRGSGRVFFFCCVEYRRCYHLTSTDDGRTFSDPADVTAAFEAIRSEYSWEVLATGPGHGIQLRSGRLLVPVWL